MPIVPNYDFLTVEDINTVILNEGQMLDEFYNLDTRILEKNNNTSYKYYRCDFIIISKTVVGNEFEYILEIRNSLWDGNYSFIELPKGINEPTVTQVLQDPNTIKIRGTGLSYFIISLHLTNNSDARVYDSEMSDVRVLNKGNLKVSGITNITIPYYESSKINLNICDMQDNPVGSVNVTIKTEGYQKSGTTDAGGNISFTIPSKAPGKTTYVITATRVGYGEYNKSFQINRLKTNINCNLENKTQIKGSYNTNKISFKSNENINKNLLIGKSVKITVNNKTITTTIGNDLFASFEVNLRGYYKNSLSVKVTLDSSEYYNQISKTFKLNCDYCYVDSYKALKSECENSKGADIIRIKNKSYASTGSITIKRDIIIQGQKGDKHWSYIDGGNKQKAFVINNKATLTLQGLELYRCNPAIYQKEGSTVIIKNCLFKQNNNSKHNQAGSCVYCNIGANSKKKTNLFNTTVEKSYFDNNYGSCFNHGGQLTVESSNFLKDSFTYFAQPEPFIVSQRYGDCIIRECKMEIDTGDSIKKDNASYAKAVCVVGKTASFNGVKGSKMLGNDTLNLFKAPYNNQSHLYVKYYYPPLETNLIACPKHGKETQASCHAVESKNWVYADGEYLGRVSWGTENRNRKLNVGIPLNGGHY